MSNEYYLGKGVGDLYIKAECVFVSKTYEVQDCLFYTENTITPTASYSDYLSRMLSNFSFDGSIDYEVEVDIAISTGGGGFSIAPISSPSYKKHIAIGYNSDEANAYYGNSTGNGEISIRYRTNPSWNTWHHWKITKNGDNFEWDYNNGVHTYSVTASWLGAYGQMGLYFYKWQSPSISVKNIKVKPL